MAIKRNLHNNSSSGKRGAHSSLGSGYSAKSGGFGAVGGAGSHRKHGASSFSASSQINNVAGYGSAGNAGSGSGRRARHSADAFDTHASMPSSLGGYGASGGHHGNRGGKKRSKRADKRRARQAHPTSRMQGYPFLDKKVATIPTSNGDVLLTRRHFLYGAAGIGVLAAAGTGAKAYSAAKASENAVSVLTVPTSAVTKSTDLTEVENGGKMSLSADITLPYGTLMWASTDDVAALLLPTETGSPLTTVSILRLSSGYSFSIIESAVGSAEGFEIYDVRATAEGVVWTEVNILEGVWRIYGAQLSDASLGEPHLLDQDTSDWETPSLALCGTTAFWQVLPNANGPKKTEDSTLRCASVLGKTLGSADTSHDTSYEIVCTSKGRMCTPAYASDDCVVVTPRAQTSGVYYQLTVINASTKEIIETLTLPQSMKPLEAGYGETGFMFSFEGIYSYGDGISNLGTYVPKVDARGVDYSAAPWFHFARTPSAPPCWCGGYLVVKSTRSVVGIDLESDTYFVLDSVSGSDTYGDYLASTGSRTRILVFANVNDETGESGSSQYCSARIYTAY